MKRNIAVTLECFVKKGNKYLMLQRSKNKKIMPSVWMAPGGKREFNEGLFAAARRGIKEESGLEIKNPRVWAIGNGYLQDIDQELFWHLIVADYAKGRLKQNGKDGKLKWLTPREILQLDNLLAEMKQVLPHLFSKKREIVSYKVVYEKGNKMIFFEKDK